MGGWLSAKNLSISSSRDSEKADHGLAPGTFSAVFSYSGEASLPEQALSIRSFLRYAGRPRSFTVVSDGSYTSNSVKLLEKIDPSVVVHRAEGYLPVGLPSKVDHFVKTYPLGRQLGLIMSLPLDAESALYVDSDVLFFPGASHLAAALVTNGVPALYLPDCREDSADFRLFRDPIERRNPVNTGLLFLSRKLDWSLAIQRYLELKDEPIFFTNQTMTHLAMHANDARALDPRVFVLQLDDQFVYFRPLRGQGLDPTTLRQSRASQVVEQYVALMSEEPTSVALIVRSGFSWWSICLGTVVWEPVEVLMESADQWRALGHKVSHFSLSEAFPASRPSGVRFALQQLLFAHKVAAFVRTNKDSFDVIDAAIGCVPYSRQALGFRGIIFARSVGLYLLYERFERVTIRRWPRRSRGTTAGRLFYGFVHRNLMRACDSSVRTADVINVPNKSEASCLCESLDLKGRIIVRNLTDSPIHTGTCCHNRTDQRKSVLPKDESVSLECGVREKGPMTGRRSSGLFAAQIPEVRFRFLGTMTDATAVRKDLGSVSEENLEFVSHFKQRICYHC